MWAACVLYFQNLNKSPIKFSVDQRSRDLLFIIYFDKENFNINSGNLWPRLVNDR